MKDKKNGGFPFPRQEKEEKQPMAPCSVPKYTEIANPVDQDRRLKGLADYAKKNKMKY